MFSVMKSEHTESLTNFKTIQQPLPAQNEKFNIYRVSINGTCILYTDLPHECQMFLKRELGNGNSNDDFLRKQESILILSCSEFLQKYIQCIMYTAASITHKQIHFICHNSLSIHYIYFRKVYTASLFS
jgi:hypothetical protein